MYTVSIKRSMMCASRYTLTLRLKYLVKPVYNRFELDFTSLQNVDCLLNSGANENIKAGNV